MKEQKVTIELVKGARSRELFNEILEALESIGNVSDHIEHIGVTQFVDRHGINWWYDVKVVFTHHCLGKEKAFASSTLTSDWKADELKKLVVDMVKRLIDSHIHYALNTAQELQRLNKTS